MPDGRSPRRRLPVLIAVAAALVAGCASLPTGGPVREGNDLQLERDDSAVRPIGQPPLPGADPEEIVRGFVRAGADFDGNHRVARLYLAPAIRERWRPGVGADLYNRAEGDVSLTVGDDGRVALDASSEARISRDGQYIPVAPGTRLKRTFNVAKVAGEWRITALEDGLVLARSAVPQIYRQLNIYFVAPSRKVLVPDPVLLPALPGLSTSVVNRLLRGPTSLLRGAVVSGFPARTSLAVASVPIRDGVATVRLETPAGKADQTARELMSAQLVWTLKQLPDFRSLRVTIDGEPIGVSGAAEPQLRDDWGKYDPATITGDASVYVVHEGRVGQLLDRKFVRVAGPAGDGRLASRSVAVSADLTRLAVVSADGRALLVGPLRRPAAPTPRLRGTDLSPPSWDAVGNVWVADRATGRLWFVPPGGAEPTPVAAEDLAAAPIMGARVARDGTRVALVVGRAAGSRMYIGAVLRDPDGSTVQITAVREVLPDLRDVRDVAWIDATRLAVVAQLRDEAPGTPVVTDSSGYDVSPLEPLPGLVSIAAAPANPIVAGTKDGRVQRYTATGEWRRMGPGTNPAYRD